jgi:hypothetical protein
MIASPDQQIDRLLHSLRDTPPPAGLAARVTSRLHQAAESPARGTLFASPQYIAWATAACAAVLALALLAAHHQPTPTVADLSSETSATQATPSLPVPATARVDPRFSVGSLGPSIKIEGVLTPGPDLDAIALAETLAPSHPAPPLPLTPQEALLLRSTRQGQPIEVAELETRRESALTEIAEARERATVREYIHGLLGPLATAQTLTPPSSPSDDSKPVAENEPPPSQ